MFDWLETDSKAIAKKHWLHVWSIRDGFRDGIFRDRMFPSLNPLLNNFDFIFDPLEMDLDTEYFSDGKITSRIPSLNLQYNLPSLIPIFCH